MIKEKEIWKSVKGLNREAQGQQVGFDQVIHYACLFFTYQYFVN